MLRVKRINAYSSSNVTAEVRITIGNDFLSVYSSYRRNCVHPVLKQGVSGSIVCPESTLCN